MRYISIVKKLDKTHHCPFCHEKPENMIEKGKYFYVIPARPPYTKDHLLIIPIRHVNTLMTLSHAEILEMYKLVDKRAKKLYTKYKDVSLLLRDGLVKDKNINKSVNHLHFHLLPNMGIEVQTKKQAKNRQRIEDEAYTKLTKNIKKRFLAK